MSVRGDLALVVDAAARERGALLQPDVHRRLVGALVDAVQRGVAGTELLEEVDFLLDIELDNAWTQE